MKIGERNLEERREGPPGTLEYTRRQVSPSDELSRIRYNLSSSTESPITRLERKIEARRGQENNKTA